MPSQQLIKPSQRDVYAAGPPVMLCEVALALDSHSVGTARVDTDSFDV